MYKIEHNWKAKNLPLTRATTSRPVWPDWKITKVLGSKFATKVAELFGIFVIRTSKSLNSFVATLKNVIFK